MMKKLSLIITAICILLMILTPIVFAEEVLSFTDETNDVLDENNKQVNRPNIDIYIISCSKEGKEVELKLQLASGGKIQDLEFIGYSMYLTTDLNEYMVDYFGGEAFAEDGEANEIDVIASSGAGTNELKISFNLSSSDEKCLNLSSYTIEYSLSGELYFDQCPEEFEMIEVDAGGPYTGTVGKTVQFYGSSDYESSDLEWSWDFGDGGESNQKNPKHTYDESGTFDVTLLVSDTEGIKMGYDETTVTISAASTPNNGGSEDSGSGLIIFVVLIIIVIIIGVAAVFFIRRR